MNVSRLESLPRLSLLPTLTDLPFLPDLRSAGGLVVNYSPIFLPSIQHHLPYSSSSTTTLVAVLPGSRTGAHLRLRSPLTSLVDYADYVWWRNRAVGRLRGALPIQTQHIPDAMPTFDRIGYVVIDKDGVKHKRRLQAEEPLATVNRVLRQSRGPRQRRGSSHEADSDSEDDEHYSSPVLSPSTSPSSSSPSVRRPLLFEALTNCSSSQAHRLRTRPQPQLPFLPTTQLSQQPSDRPLSPRRRMVGPSRRQPSTCSLLLVLSVCTSSYYYFAQTVC